MNQENNAIISEYSHDFEKNGKSYTVEVKCHEKPVKRSEAAGELYTAVYILEGGALTKDFYLLDHVDESGAADIFADVESKLELLLKSKV